jgi:hypothetical protein
VSRDKLADTHASLVRRRGGTLIGIGGVITNLIAAYLVTAMTGQIALSAVILRSRGAGRLAMRVCMWTGSIVLLIADLTLSIDQVVSLRQ